MAQVLNSLVVSVGANLSDAKAANAALDTPRPVVSWAQPSGIKIARYNVLIQTAAPSGIAFTTSGPRTDGLNYFQLPYGLAMDWSFQGLCQAVVSVSQNITGDFEYVSPPCYFVFDREIERLHNANDIAVRWAKPQDPDNLPMSPPWEYRLQVASDCLFQNLIYDNASGIVLAANDPHVYIVHDVGTKITTPPSLDPGPAPTGYQNFNYDGTLQGPLSNLTHNVPYFYRVAAWDGLDWGQWSHTEAFYNTTNGTPTFKFVSVTPTGNQFGDVAIVFRVTGDGPVTVELSFTGGPHVYQGDPIPLSLIESNLILPPGTWQVTWRSPRQLGYADFPIMFYGRARDDMYVTVTDIYGPVDVNNMTIPNPATNFGSLVWQFPAVGAVTKLAPSTSFDDTYPTGDSSFFIGSDSETDMFPVVLGRYAWWNAYMLAPAETYDNAKWTNLGFGHDGQYNFVKPYTGKSITKLYWPEPMAQFNVQGGPKWADAYRAATEVKVALPVSQQAFLFSAPVDNTVSTTLPSVMATRDFPVSRYLKGYTDLDGTPRNYPDEYDWNNRPDWHIGREIYGQDDAWLQTTYWKSSNLHACQICNGNHWVPSSGSAPYTRKVCPNVNCVDGFDVTNPIYKTKGAKRWIVSEPYNVIKWYHLSTFLQPGEPFGQRRNGIDVSVSPLASGIQHILGRQIAYGDGNGVDPNTKQFLRYIVNEPEGNTRTFPGTTVRRMDLDYTDGRSPASDLQQVNSTVNIVKRQDPGFGVTLGKLSKIITTEIDETDMLPVALGNTTSKISFTSPDSPVKGFIRNGSQNWLLGGADPSTSIVHASRGTQPNEAGAIAVAGQLQRKWEAANLDFRFLPAWWAEYQTLHIGQTGSDTNLFQIQYATLSNGGVTGPWSDVVGDNATYDSQMQGWFVDPLKFHEFWDTSVASAFPEGTRLVLRTRMYDPVSHTLSEWRYSHPVQILHGMTNPVNFVSTTYDRFTKTVEIVLRIDDKQGDTYNLTRFWYSPDNGKTWNLIARGDIHGQITNLESGDGNQNIVTHTITWNTTSYNLSPSDDFRLNIECLPTRFASETMLPYFRWNIPRNPNVDEASSTLAQVLGKMQTLGWNSTTTQWELLNPPLYNPGQLYATYQALERVRRDPDPSGIYGFITFNPPNPLPSGSIPDISGAILPNQIPGYQQWLTGSYGNNQTRGDAIRDLNETIDRLVNVVIPQAEDTVINGERAIRRDLINQGYYAEQNFQGTMPSGIVEQVYVDPISNHTGDDTGSHVLRQWLFQVQNTSNTNDGGVVDEHGVYNPQGTVTELERVLFRVQIDGRTTFDSQTGKLPLRDIFYDFDGNRINSAAFFGGKDIQSFFVNSGTTSAQNQTGAWTGQATDKRPNLNAFQPTTTQPVLTVGGTMKLAPADLPGNHTADLLPGEFTDGWGGTYQWRVAAYNAFNGPNIARPRPQVIYADTSPAIATMAVGYVMRGNKNISTASVSTQVSKSYLLNPTWTTPTALNFVSDRRALPNQFSKSSTRPWIPTSKDRPHPCVFWDDDKMMYMAYTTKLTYDGVTYRVINSRAQSLPDVCEYQNYFDDDGSLAIYRPSVVKANGQYYMYVSVQPANGSAFVGYSTSVDGETWTTIKPIVFAGDGINPCVIYKDGTFKLWYEKQFAGVVKIVYAQSADGVFFSMQNGGAAVYGEATNVGCPGVVFNNGNYIMYLNDAANNIISVYSADGIHWTGRRVEFSQASVTLPLNDHPTLVNPKNPYPFLDLYNGNSELMLAFNYQVAPSGQNYVYLTRLEDRVWASGVRTLSLDDSLDAVTVSPSGTFHALAMDLAANGLSAGDPIKVRIVTGNVAPDTIEYHRQSEWVTYTDLIDDWYMDPTQWVFNTALNFIPYLTLPTV